MADLVPGDHAPNFQQRSPSNREYNFNYAAGRYVALCFYGSAGHKIAGEAIKQFWTHKDLFNDDKASFFGVSVDSRDEQQQRVSQSLPGYRLLWDFDFRVSKLYGVTKGPVEGQPTPYKAATFVLDPNMRILGIFPINDPDRHVRSVTEFIKALPDRDDVSVAKPPPPILVVPMVFEPELCRHLIQLYEKDGGEDSGFIRTDPSTGKTVTVIDHSRKARRDYSIDSAELRETIRARIEHRLAPEIMKCFHFTPTRIERYIVACYDARDNGHFLAHRDDTTKGAAHRKFAVTINLNAEEYEGGNLRFPEYDSRQYRAPTGGAVVFSCSVLHEATAVTRGKRYAVLPFLYDEESAKIRAANLKYIDDENLREQIRRQIRPPEQDQPAREVAAAGE